MKKYITNILYLLLENFVKILLTFVAGAYVARSLGPDMFGEYSYIRSFVMLFSFIPVLGLEIIVIKELVAKSEQRNEIISSALILRFLSSMLTVLFIFSFSYYFEPDRNIELSLYSLVFMCQVFYSIEYYYSAEVRSKELSKIKLASFALLALSKICVVYFDIGIIFLLLCDSFAALLLSLCYLNKIRFGEVSLEFRFDTKRMKELLVSSLPLIMSSAAIIVFTRTDQIMIEKMLGTYENGIYAAMVVITTSLFIVPTVLSNTLYPKLVERHSTKNNYFDEFFTLKNEIILIVCSVVLLPIFIFNEEIIKIIYGKDYLPGSEVLVVHILVLLFTGMGISSNKWIVAKGLQSIVFYRTLMAAIVNIILNYIFIPRFGIVGAAYASLISMSISGVFANLIIRQTRDLFYLQLRTLTFTQIRKAIAKLHYEYVNNK